MSRNSHPRLEEVKALHGRIYAMLSAEEKDAFLFVVAQGRKFDVAVSLINDADPQTLRSLSKAEAEQLLMSSNSIISVTMGPGTEAAWPKSEAARISE